MGRAKEDATISTDHHARQHQDQDRNQNQDQPPERSQWLILAVVLVGSFMAVLDTTIVNVALPSIAVGTHAASAALEWVVSGYALAFGLALVPAGRIGDRYGYKRLFIGGLILFTLASLACGLARSPGELIAARIVQGLGAGVYFPFLVHTSQAAILVNLGLVFAALLCSFGLPSSLSSDHAEENA